MIAAYVRKLANKDRFGPIGPDWRPAYWLIAVTPGVVMALFETLQAALYDTMRAPNVSLAAQAWVTLAVFYLPTALIPRVAWTLNKQPWPRILGAHAAVALALGSLHLVLITLGLAAMHAPTGWLPSLPIFVGEIWIGKFPLWATVYALTAGLLWRLQPRPDARRSAPPLELRRGGRVHIVPLSEVILVQALGNYVEIHTARAGAFTLRETIAAFERRAGAGALFRVHRSALANPECVRAIRAESAGSYRVELEGGAEAPLSRRRAAELKRRLRAER